jgi:hypothetical protein
VGRLIALAAAGLAVVVVFAAAAAGVLPSAFSGGGGCRAALAHLNTVPGGLTVEQAGNAAVIVAVGARMGVPVRGWVIAIATALQESDLINTTAGDHDSLGLFQQRPSQGWGTVEQIMNPDYAARTFYQHLLRVPGWQALPLTVAAQAVQRSAFPGAYAKHEARAAGIVAAYTGGIVCDGGDGLPGSLTTLPPGFTLPPGTPVPVAVAIRWALAQLGTPYSYGGSCTAPHSGLPARQCDCSSLTQMAFRAARIVLPRTTADQVHAGTPVAGLADLRPGDLIFIPGSGGTSVHPGHVGMAVGSGLLVQAPHTGDVVKVSRVFDWASQVAAIRRIVPN